MICARIARLGIKRKLCNFSLEIGELCLPDLNQFVMASSSYVCPSTATTGSVITSQVIGQKNSPGKSELSSRRCEGGDGAGSFFDRATTTACKRPTPTAAAAGLAATATADEAASEGLPATATAAVTTRVAIAGLTMLAPVAVADGVENAVAIAGL